MTYDVDVLEQALRNFIDTIEATGGVMTNEDGFVAPVIDPEWTDLGDSYMVACDALGVEPMMEESEEDYDGDEDTDDDDADAGDINAYGDRDV